MALPCAGSTWCHGDGTYCVKCMCSLPKGNKLQPWERWLKEPICLHRGWWKESLWNSQSEMIWTIVAGEGVRYRGQRCRVWSQVTPVGHGLQRNGSSVAWELITQRTEESRAVWNGPKALFFFHFSLLSTFYLWWTFLSYSACILVSGD